MLRPFAPTSFWNMPLSAHPELDEKSPAFIKLLQTTGSCKPALYLNSTQWTIPVYRVRSSQVPLVQVFPVRPRLPHTGFAPNFNGWAPIPPGTRPDAMEDSHLCIIDDDRDLVYDFLEVSIRDGHYYARCAVTYPLYGSGVLDEIPFPVEPNTSIHDYGPCRAAGTTLLGGLVFREELAQGRIEHKLALATDRNEHQQYLWPALWTDGFTPGGIPEGAVLQLDPTLDLGKFDLCPAARTLARAMQEYGMVNVDVAGGVCLYLENLNHHPGQSWPGLVDSGWILEQLGLEHLCVLKMQDVRHGGLFRDKKPW